LYVSRKRYLPEELALPNIHVMLSTTARDLIAYHPEFPPAQDGSLARKEPPNTETTWEETGKES
jgi:hypothetical protein